MIWLLAALAVTVGLAMAFVAHGRRYPPDVKAQGFPLSRKERR